MSVCVEVGFCGVAISSQRLKYSRYSLIKLSLIKYKLKEDRCDSHSDLKSFFLDIFETGVV